MMLTLASELLTSAIRPGLYGIGAASRLPEAEDLTLGTAAHESGGFLYRVQVGGGPARGLWQIERVTHDSIRQEWSRNHPAIMAFVDSLLEDGLEPWAQVEHNDKYSAAICRLKYSGDPWPLPKRPEAGYTPEYVRALGAIYKRVYNASGKGSAETFTSDFYVHVLGLPAPDAPVALTS